MKGGAIPYKIVTLGPRDRVANSEPTGRDVNQYLRTAVAEDKPVHLWAIRIDDISLVPLEQHIVADIQRVDLVHNQFECALTEGKGWFSITIPDLRQSPITFELLKH